MLLDIREGDEILVPAHTWCATAISFARLGAKIIWVDIDPETLVLNLESIKKVVSKKTKGNNTGTSLWISVLPNGEISEFCKKRNIIIIEDCAQSLGASINKKLSGAFGDISMFSFHANKNITTLGEGGMITVNSARYAKNINLLKHNGVSLFDEDREFYC